MVWYGPGGLGTYATVEAFDQFQRPFEKTFSGWGDGKEDGISGVGSLIARPGMVITLSFMDGR